MKHVERRYGFLPGGDPRKFEPDEEVNTPEELAAWRTACEAWNRGEQAEPAFSSHVARLGDGVAFLDGSSYGMGIYVMEWDCDADDDVCMVCGPKDEAAP
jgi:hypothetical protein